MDLSLGPLVPIFISFLVISSVFAALFMKTKKPNHRNAPEPAGSWPVIGHLHLLGGKEQLLYRTLGAMADDHGPASPRRVGSRRAFVVSSWEVAKECFTVNDKALASRPMTVASKHMGYNYAVFGFAPYSSFWRKMRKIATVELLSNRRLQMLKHVRISEISTGIKDLHGLWSKKGGSSPVLVDLKRWLEDMNLNMIVKMVAGKRYFGSSAKMEDAEEARQCQRAIARFFHLIGIFVVSDALPFLGWFDLQGHEKEMRKTASELDGILERWIDEHQRRRVSGQSEGDSDFIDVMLSLEGEGKLSDLQYDPRTSIKSTCLALILGGSDTTAGTLTWAIALLLNNREMLKKAQEEIDIHVGKNRQVEDSDIENLVYLQAIIKETLRLYPAGPLLGPREAMEDCTVAGYQVAAGTRLIVNVWKIQRDPKVWRNPEEFRPERFLTGKETEYDVRGQNFELMPFGSGRRSCPGASLALQVLHLSLARVLHSFDLLTVSDSEVDMRESPGLTIPKATPLEVLLTPRLEQELYEL
ncbi:PREDICTED: cytochrome P450 82C4-like [Tarenaya hassleriana]|uniref:cytochrome P450 82C4-like n=1 Tax=Tarenaya hassleriana TaxID=28532 RepID=UPI0008FD86E3|nr:PREDICTED: cytochrome P450 82C4-like [Tarenaya hassleriana]